jgi:hypothetical protein
MALLTLFLAFSIAIQFDEYGKDLHGKIVVKIKDVVGNMRFTTYIANFKCFISSFVE